METRKWTEEQVQRRWDSRQALHYVSLGWHEGQSSVLYRLGCRCEYRPGAAWDGRLDRDEDAGARELAARYLRAWRLRPARRR